MGEHHHVLPSGIFHKIGIGSIEPPQLAPVGGLVPGGAKGRLPLRGKIHVDKEPQPKLLRRPEVQFLFVATPSRIGEALSDVVRL
jgi:hypothetical protein